MTQSDLHEIRVEGAMKECFNNDWWYITDQYT